jgi:putative ABC transport system permease protein
VSAATPAASTPPPGPPFSPLRRLRSLLWKSSVEAEVESELSFHLEMRILDYQARGMDAVEARAAALARFGDLAAVAAACRELGHGRDRKAQRRQGLAELRQDLRFAARQLAAAPASTAAAVLILGIALGAAAATFGVFDALLLRPLPLAAPDRLVRLWARPPAATAAVGGMGGAVEGVSSGVRGEVALAELPVSEADFLDWLRASRSFTGMAAFEAGDRNLTGNAGAPAAAAPEKVRTVRATAGLFPLLGVAPALGRTFTAREDERHAPHRLAVLSDRFWRRRFGGEPGVVGRELGLDGSPHRVIGVMPRGFELPAGADLWLPLVPDRGPARQPPRDHRSLEVVARLRPGVSAAQAEREMIALAAELARRHPETNLGWGVSVTSFAEWALGARLRARAGLALAAVALLWLAACANVSNLLLVRAAARQRELDIRAALGAGRRRILRQLLTESLLLAALAAPLGLLLTGAALGAVRRAASGLLPAQPALHPPPPLAAVAPDARLLLFLLAATVATGLLFGLVPALQGSRPGVFETLRQGVRMAPPAHRRGREVLLLAQATLAMVLLVGAGLAVRGFLRLLAADPGFEPAHVTALHLALNGERYDAAARRSFMAALEPRLARLPGVVAVGITSAAPWSAARPSLPFLLRREPDGRPIAAEWRSATPGLLAALGMAVRRGRWLSTADGDGREPVAVIDEETARRWWPGEDPVGRRIRWGWRERPLTIVGVVAALRDVEIEGEPRPTLFLPYAQWPWRSMMLVVKSRPRRPPGGASQAPATAAATAVASGAVPAAGLADQVRREVAALDPGLPVGPPRALARSREEQESRPRLALLPLLLFALAALALAAAGLYGATAAAVAQRRREIGIRLALGARASGVLRLLLARGLALTLLGAALGALAMLLLSPLLALPLFGIAPRDGAAYLAGSALLAATSTAASLLAARRAARLTPLLALHGE